jgi:acyl carrier protein
LELRKYIRDYIIENSLNGFKKGSLDFDDSFLDKGIIDSTGILELVSFVEEEFGIEVKDEELIPDNFDSVNRLAEYISLKKAS